MTLPMDIIDEFQNFSQKHPFFHFWPFRRLGTPLYGQALTEGGFGEHIYGPQAVPGTEPQPRKNRSLIRSPTPVLRRYIISGLIYVRDIW